MKKFLFLFIIALLAIGVVSATDRTFTITMGDSRSSYEIDYVDTIANVTSYTFESDADLAGSQNWVIYGSNDASGWSYIDEQSSITFTAGVPQTFTPVDPKNYTYYLIYLSDGFYAIGGSLDLTFHASEYNNPVTLCPTTGSGIPLLPSRQFNVTIDNVRSSYEVNYVSLIANMTSYSFESDTDLNAVQSWTIYGSDANNETGWSYIDEQQLVGFTAGVPQVFTPTDPKNYTYYFIYLSDGFYVGGSALTITFYSTEYYNLLTTCGVPIPPLPPYIKSAGYPPINDPHLFPVSGSGAVGATAGTGNGSTYFDFTIWISLLATSMILLIISIIAKDLLWKVIASGISFLTAIIVTYGSLSVAHLGDVAELGSITAFNASDIFHVRVIQIVATGWTTLICGVASVLIFLYLVHSILLFTEVKKTE
jgi:hypothetical protein